MVSFEVDELSLYFGNEIKIADGIILRSPSIDEVVHYGEKEYFSMAQTLCSTPSSMKVALNDMNIDWMKISDFQLFIMIAPTFPRDKTKILLGDLDLSQLHPYQLNETGEVVLSNKEHTVTINEVMYEILVTYLRKMHNFQKQVDKAGNSITHKVLIDVARQDAKRAQNQPYKSYLLPLVSALQCRQKYTKDYIKNMSIFEFLNQFARAQIIVNADAALGGCYSGMCDTSKMDKSILDWTREITEESKTKNKTILKEGAN